MCFTEIRIQGKNEGWQVSVISSVNQGLKYHRDKNMLPPELLSKLSAAI